MTNKATKYGIMIIAAVLVMALAFAGAASAVLSDEITSDTWNSWGDDVASHMGGDTVWKITGDENAVIYPKFNGSTGFTPGADLTLDFSEYKGTFSGEDRESTNGLGALFGYVNLSGVDTKRTLTIKNLNLTNVKVNATSKSNIGGVVGYFKGKSKTESFLNFSDCRLVNCSITGASDISGHVGGLVGYAYFASVNVVDCKALHCDVVSGSNDVGGLVGCAASASFVGCNVTNCTVASTASTVSGNVGGLVGYAGSASFETCGVENTSVYAGGASVGGLVGNAGSASFETFVDGCNVKNCVIASGSNRVGGLVGYAISATNHGISNCHVVNCTIAGSYRVGGLVGKADNTPSGWSRNSVENCAVNCTSGSSTTVNLVCGSIPAMENPDNCTVGDGNFINNGTISDSITLSSPLGPGFWNTISYTQAGNESASKPMRTVTSLGTYGMLGGYGVGSAPTVTYDKNGATSGEGWTAAYTMGATVTVADKNSLAKTGYNFTGWNKDSVTGTLVQAGDTFKITADTVFYANWTVNTTNVTASDNKAEFGNDNVTAIHSTAGTVVKVLLENVSQVTDTAVNFTADNTSVSIPSVTGYTKEEIAVFEINASAVGTARINVTVTFADAPTANTNKDKVRFFHYNVSEWEPLTSTIADETDAKVLYTVEATSFSPFGIGIYTALPPQYTPSSSRNTGSTIILQEGQVAPNQQPTVAPTVAPTAAPTEKPAAPTVAPTAKPTAQQTQQSPAPVLGLIAGLGVAGLIYRLRK